MTRRLRRVVVLVAGITGLLALVSEPADALWSMQHCEPLAEP